MTDQVPPLYEEGFAIIPRHVLHHPGLTYAEKIIYGRLVPLMLNERGYCWADNGQISEFSGVKHRTVERAIPKLADVGLVRITGAQNQSRRIYPATTLDIDALPTNRRTALPQNGVAAPANRRTRSREGEEQHMSGNSPAEMARIAERILDYHDELRLRINPAGRSVSGKTRVAVLGMIGALMTNDVWTEDRLRLVVEGHLADGSWWREQGHIHARYAFRDEVNAERMADGAAALVVVTEDGDWSSVDDSEPDHEGAWEGLHVDAGGFCEICEDGGCDACQDV